MKHRTKALALRLPEDLYRDLREVAAQQGASVNRYIVETIAARLKVKEKEALYHSFTELGNDLDSDVEFAFEAQREAISD